jgi:hypothetical protein
MAIGAVKSFIPHHDFDHFTGFHVSREQIATVLKALVSATFRVAVPAFA